MRRVARADTMAPPFTSRQDFSMRRLAFPLLALLLAPLPSLAVDIVFDTQPFTGSTANPNDGVRTVFGGLQRSLPGFDFQQDRFVFDAAAFPQVPWLGFASGLSSTFPASGTKLFVIHDTGAGFNAGSAANAIANAVTEDGAGFFVYHNVGLQVNRLVYSTNLNLATADLSILARIESPSGSAALAALPGFNAQHFAVTSAVPEPANAALLLAGLGLLARRLRRRAA
jgi:PEP-CTERM motif